MVLKRSALLIAFCVALCAALQPPGIPKAAARPFLPRSLARAPRVAVALRAGRRYWQTDLVVVVTWWASADKLEWLASLPLATREQPTGARLVLYAKGTAGGASCRAIPEALLYAVAACVETHNAGGREAHTILSFVTEHYDRPPRLTLFVQDSHTLVHQNEVWRLFNTSVSDLPAWVSAAERAPFTSKALCLCKVEREDWFRECSAVPPPNPNLRCYGDMYHPMRWVLSVLLSVPEATLRARTRIRFPAGAQFVLPGWALRGARAKPVYATLLELANATQPNDGSRAGLDERVYEQSARLVLRTPAPHNPARPWSSNEWAHIMERLWFDLFAVDEEGVAFFDEPSVV